MLRLLQSVALLAACLPCAWAQAVLPTYAVSTADTDAQQWARAVMQGRTLNCVYVAADAVDSRGNGLAHINADISAGRAIRTALQSVRHARLGAAFSFKQ